MSRAREKYFLPVKWSIFLWGMSNIRIPAVRFSFLQAHAAQPISWGLLVALEPDPVPALTNQTAPLHPWAWTVPAGAGLPELSPCPLGGLGALAELCQGCFWGERWLRCSLRVDQDRMKCLAGEMKVQSWELLSEMRPLWDNGGLCVEV